jgi:hypothetical protein
MTIAEIPETTSEAVRPAAVAWIDDRHAVVVDMDRSGRTASCTIQRQGAPLERYLALVADAIGDRERVLILGPSDARLELEREYVAIYHRPDRLIDVEPAGPIGTMDLTRRLRELAG